MTLSEIQKLFRSALAGHYSDQENAQIFFLVSEHLLNYSKIDIILKAKDPISEEAAEKFIHMINRLEKWEPVQYILGHTWFYNYMFRVDSRVLIPRQETEELVQWIAGKESGKSCDVLDIGTGSGCIAVSLALNLPMAKISACDISNGALEVAGNNAQINKARVNFFQMDLLDDCIALPQKYQVMVSNPPYVRNSEKVLMMNNVLEYEPALALFVPDDDPLTFYRRIALIARKYLSDGGSLYLEINENFPVQVVKLLEGTGFYGIEVRNDINGKSRMIRAVK